METIMKHSMRNLFLKIVAAILVMAFMANLSIPASAEATKKKYVREVILVTATDKDDAKIKADEASTATRKSGKESDYRDYFVFDTPIYESDKTKTYICYATTDKPGLALTSIKAMNMEGGWSYVKYNEYLDSLVEKTKLMTNDFADAISEYNANLAEETSKALYAKSLFDRLTFEETVDGKETKKTVSEFFDEMNHSGFNLNSYKERLMVFIMESNTTLLCAVENALMTACADTYDNVGYNLFDEMEEDWFMEAVDDIASDTQNSYAEYDSYCQTIIDSLPEAQRYIKTYLSANHVYTPEMDEVFEIEEEIFNYEADKQKLSAEKRAEKYPNRIMEIRVKGMNEGDTAYGFDKEQMAAAKDLYEYDKYLDTLSNEKKSEFSIGKTLHWTLSQCEYKGYTTGTNFERQYDNFLDFITKYDLTVAKPATPNYKVSDFYPLIVALSPGQLGMLKIGFSQLVCSIMIDAGTLELNKSIMLDAINEIAEEGEEIGEDDTISMFYGVDRTLFVKDSGIALTSEALDEENKKTLGSKKVEETKLGNISKWVAIGFAVPSAVGIGVITGCTLAMKVAFSGVATKGLGTVTKLGVTFSASNGYGGAIQMFNISGAAAPIVKVQSETASIAANTFGNCLKSFLFTNLGAILGIVTIITIAITVIEVLIWVAEYIKVTNEDKAYIDAPRVMCACEPITDKSGVTENEYIYYYGVKNPLLNEQDQKRAAAARLTAKDFNILKYRVADVANWTLSGPNREWIALYSTTDKRVGRPILADEPFMVTTDPLKISNGYTQLVRFNTGDAYNMHKYYGISTKTSGLVRYVGYKMERADTSASVFSNISPIGALVVGLIIGGIVAGLSTYFITKKRKRKKEPNAV